MPDIPTIHEAPPEAPPATISLSRLQGVAKLALTFAPLVVWLIKLEVGNAKRDMLLEQQKDEIAELKEDLKEAKGIDKSVQEQALKLVQLEGKLDAANGRLDEIRDLLRR